MSDAARGRAARPGLLLRPVEAADLPALYEQQADVEASAMAGFPTRDWAAFSAHWQGILRNRAVRARVIEVNGVVVGNIGAFEAEGRREVGYWLGRDYWGQGFATAALTAFLLEETARPLYAHVAIHNVASQWVLEKCGFAPTDEASAEEVVMRFDRA